MPWFKVDDNLAFHAKVVAAGNPALGLWVRAGAWCAQQLTDGFIPDHMLAALGTRQQAQRLVDNRLWDRVQGGYRFHEWTERQPSKGEVEAERAAARDRMREFRAKKKGTAQTSSTQVEGACADDVRTNTERTSPEVRDLFGNPDPTHPDPTHPDPEETSTTALAVTTTRPDVERLVEHLAQRIHANGGNPKPNKRWHDAARLMLDNDDLTETEIHGAIDWCQSDEFWRANILSLPKLREKYDQLRLQAQRSRGPTSRVQETNDIFERAARRMGVVQ